MLIVVDPHSGIPVYRQVMDQVKLLIASGRLQPGAELPSTRSLSASLGVNPMTISKAYGLLERDRVLERRPGRRLVVRPLGEAERRDQRLERLRESLRPTARMVGQLGIDWEEALGLFGELLAAEAPGRASEESES